LSKKKQAGFETVSFLVNVAFWSALDLTLNQRVRTRVSAAHQTYLMAALRRLLAQQVR
jgi:hypothetical protein